MPCRGRVVIPLFARLSQEKANASGPRDPISQRGYPDPAQLIANCPNAFRLNVGQRP